MTEPIAWINGVHCPFSQAAVPVWDMGVVAGAAVTEMARTYRHRPFRLEKHVQRLVNSLRELNFPQPFSANELTVAATEIVAQNVRRLPKDKNLASSCFLPPDQIRLILVETAVARQLSFIPLNCHSTFGNPVLKMESGFKLLRCDRYLPNAFP